MLLLQFKQDKNALALAMDCEQPSGDKASWWVKTVHMDSPCDMHTRVTRAGEAQMLSLQVTGSELEIQV